MFMGTHPAAFDGSAIPSKTIEAYLTTEYRIGGPSPFVILIGRRHCGLAALLADPDERPSAAVLTAWNPFSRRTRKSENRRAHASSANSIGNSSPTVLVTAQIRRANGPSRTRASFSISAW